MAQLLVRKIEDGVVRKLREQAMREGVSLEEAHRRVLRRSLLGEYPPSFKEYLRSMPDMADDTFFERPRKAGRRRVVL